MLDLDANATTAPDPAVIEAMLPCLTQHYGNPSASHVLGRRARRLLETARGQVAALLGAEPGEIVFTSGGTESINSTLAFAQTEWPDRPQLIVGRTEHSAVLEAARRWQQRGGEVAWLPVDGNGLPDPAALRAALEPGRAALVSLIWANNETGVISPMAELVEIAHAGGARVHADAVQAAGKIPLDVRRVPVDYLSLSGHKMHAAKGVGALYVSRHAAFRPYLVGGGQESGRRSGTENLPGIVGYGKAAELAIEHLAQGGAARLAARRDAFEAHLRAALPELVVHGEGAPRLPQTSSIAFPGLDAAGLQIRLDQQGLACSGGSACHSASLHPSHVLEAMGYDAAHAASTLRFSFSRLTSEAELERAAETLIQAVRWLRGLRPGDASPVIG